MKRVISLLLVAVMVLTSMATLGFAAEPVSTLNIASVTANPGDEVEIAFKVTGDAMEGFEFDIELAKGLSLVSVVAGDTFKGGNIQVFGNYVAGMNASALEANGTLVVATIKVADDATAGDYTIKASNAIFTVAYEGKQTAFDFVVNAGKITIEGEEPACEHKNVEWKVTTEPDCVNEGVETGTCVDCGVVVGTRPVAALGHVEGDPKVVVEPDCVNAGKAEVYCTRCNELLRTEEIAALGHKWSTLWASDKTHHWHGCEVCHKDDVRNDVGEHIWGNWDTVKEPTEKEEGLLTAECTVCEYPYEQILPKLPTPDDPTPPPTGDISGIVTTGLSALVIVLFSLVAIVNKRKAA